MRYLCVIALMLTTGCATALTDKGKSVRLLKKQDAPAHCKEIGAVGAGNPMMWNEQAKFNALREVAAEKGADTVTFDYVEEGTGLFIGTAFKCRSRS